MNTVTNCTANTIVVIPEKFMLEKPLKGDNHGRPYK